MKLFRLDNTTDYTQKELDALNAEWELRVRVQALDPDGSEADLYLIHAKAFQDEVSRR